ncbi:MAG: hypothetical protein KGN00_08740 [Chloroflexota bacterium]|nr:hypothetical protein [Chloroflexota bacterium]MDE3193756.1 hypothetical protein [Chloroflexota bacterium]
MRDLLEGRRFGFALRPPLGNVALGLGVAVTLLDLMAWIGLGSRDTNGFVVGAYWLCAATAILGILALVTAVAEMRDVPEEERTLARLDAGGALAVIVLYAASAALRSTDLGAAGAAPLPFLMAIAGLLVLLVGSAMSSLLYAAREWEEIEELARETHRRRAAAR